MDDRERGVDIKEIPDAPVLALVNFGEFGESESKVRLDILKIKDVDGGPLWIPQFVQVGGGEVYPLDKFLIPGEAEVSEEWARGKKRFEDFLTKTELPISLSCHLAFNTDEAIEDYVGEGKVFLCSIYGPAGFGKSALCAVLKYQMDVTVMDWDGYSGVSLESYKKLVDGNFRPEDNLRRLGNLSEEERNSLDKKPKEQKKLSERLTELVYMYKRDKLSGVIFLDMPGVEIDGGRKADVYDIFARFGSDAILMAGEGQHISDNLLIVNEWEDFVDSTGERVKKMKDGVVKSVKMEIWGKGN